jgi:hypothetical protein
MVEKRMREWGPNELPEKKKHPLLILLGYFWGPMPIMIWIAAGVELAKASAGYGGWEDFAVSIKAIIQLLIPLKSPSKKISHFIPFFRSSIGFDDASICKCSCWLC